MAELQQLSSALESMTLAAVRMTRSVGRRRSFFEAEPLHFLVERRAIDAELVGSLALSNFGGVSRQTSSSAVAATLLTRSPPRTRSASVASITGVIR